MNACRDDAGLYGNFNSAQASILSFRKFFSIFYSLILTNNFAFIFNRCIFTLFFFSLL